MIKILIGGSPCTFWSIAQKERETEASGQGWELFKNFLIAKEKFKPDFFLYENNESISKEIQREIEKYLQTDLLHIDSGLVSAQKRKRIYATNIRDIEPPRDRGIKLQNILEYGTTNREKSKTVRVGGCNSGWGNKHEWDMPNPNRVYTTIELERLQTLPDNYTQGVPDRQRRKSIGNGWTAEVIIYILQHALWNVPKHEKIIVLSLYDGIATGRYCIDRLGFYHVQYYSYEIDKYAMEIALKNYPDIIQLGDAFQVRNDNWKLPN